MSLSLFVRRPMLLAVFVASVACNGALALAFPAPKLYQPLPGAKLEMVEENCDREYNIRFVARASGRGGEARLRFNARDDGEGYELVLSPARLRLNKIETGLQFTLLELDSVRLNGKPAELLLKRRPQAIVLVADDQIVGTAYDSTFSRGSVAFANDGVVLSDVRVQPLDELFYADDFMKPAGEMGEWEPLTGKWQINSLENPVLSSNAFSMLGAAAKGPALCASGYWFWDSYEYTAALQASGDGAVGVAFAVADAAHYYAVRWEPLEANGRRGKRQLLRIRNGKSTVLDESSGGYLAGQWYALQTAMRDGFVQVSIDGNSVLSAADPGLSHGKVGLYTECPSTTFFDDVEVHGLRALADDFERPAAGAWTWQGGEWQIAKDEGNGRLHVTSEAQAQAISQGLHCRSFECSVTVDLEKAKTAGLTFHYQDPLNYYAYVVDATKPALEFWRSLEGKRTLLESVELLKLRDRPTELRLRCEEGHFRGAFDDMDLLQAWDGELREGRVGLLAEGAAPVAFDDFHLALIDRQTRSPVYTVHEVFSKEKSMEDWAAAQSDWLSSTEGAENDGTKLQWHRADFYGDTETEVLLGDLSEKGTEVRLIANAEEQELGSGYAFALRRGQGLEALLYRNAEVVVREPLKGNDEPAEMAFRRCGRFLVGVVDQQPVLHYGDKHPLRGITVGYATTKTNVSPEDVNVYADNVHTYTFQRATSDWRTAAGIWEVTNRWECDPRWSFFSGRQDGDVAVIWNKRHFRGDMTLEFCGATKMNRSKEKRAWQYDYASDINATIAADAQDLTSGYSFVFGGWDNTATRLLKGTQVLAENTEKLIPSRHENIHHKWFYLKIQKRGNRLRYWIDNELVFDVEDPKPLDGNRIALWTRDNGVMVARVRVSAEDGSRCELLERPPGSKVRSIYDDPENPA